MGTLDDVRHRLGYETGMLSDNSGRYGTVPG